MKFDKYSLKARFYPAVITLLPFILLSVHLSNTKLNEIFNQILAVKIIANVSVSAVLLYLLIQLNRFLSKELFEKRYFKGELEMPTTQFMLYSDDEYTEQKKLKVREKVKKDFNFDMPDKEMEQRNEYEARKGISEAVGFIRNKVKNGNLLLQHNIEYGFVRNLIGGSVLGLLVSIISLGYFYMSDAPILFSFFSSGLSIIYSGLLLGSKFIISRFGKLYAKRLFIEYL